MRIALVGGVERNEQVLSRIAEESGHFLEYHGGHMKGRGVAEIDRLVERADLVIVVTDVNSHTAVMMARRSARRLSREVRLMKNCNPTKFRAVVAELSMRAA